MDFGGEKVRRNDEWKKRFASFWNKIFAKMRKEDEARRRAQELEELSRLDQERQRQLMEVENRRKREEEEARKRLAVQEQQYQEELAREQARRAEEEQRRRLIEEQQRAQRKALEEAQAERAKQKQVAAKAEAAAKAEQQRIRSLLLEIFEQFSRLIVRGRDNFPFLKKSEKIQRIGC